MEKFSLTKSIWIDASRERVWQAITDPKQFQQWFSPPTPWTQTTLEVGGTMSPVGFEEWASTIEVVDAPYQFSYRYQRQQDDSPITMVATYTLDEEKGGTRLTLIEDGFTDQDGTAQNSSGWDMGFANLVAYLAGDALPYPEGL